MAMSRKDFIALAHALNDTKPADSTLRNDERDQWNKDCRAVANVCAEMGSSFDRQRFMTACETRSR